MSERKKIFIAKREAQLQVPLKGVMERIEAAVEGQQSQEHFRLVFPSMTDLESFLASHNFDTPKGRYTAIPMEILAFGLKGYEGVYINGPSVGIAIDIDYVKG